MAEDMSMLEIAEDLDPWPCILATCYCIWENSLWMDSYSNIGIRIADPDWDPKVQLNVVNEIEYRIKRVILMNWLRKKIPSLWIYIYTNF